MLDKIPVNTRYDPPQLNSVDVWRREQPTIPSRSAALRELLRRALEAEARRRSKEHAA